MLAAEQAASKKEAGDASLQGLVKAAKKDVKAQKQEHGKETKKAAKKTPKKKK